MFDFIFNPSAPRMIEEFVLIGLQTVVVTLVVWYLSAAIALRTWNSVISNRAKSWTGLELVMLSYADGALVTAGMWSIASSYVYISAKYSGSIIAFFPHWLGIFLVLMIAAILIILLRRRVRRGLALVTKIESSI